MEEKKTKTEEKKKAPRKPRAVKTVGASKTVKAVKTETVKKAAVSDKYSRALGRRKEATAIAKIFLSKKGITVNGKTLDDYFKVLEMQKIVQEVLKAVDLVGKVGVEITAKGGGMRGQAEAARLAIARALLKHDQELKKVLKIRGFFTRDAREKERKKFGLKKARKAFQWSKR